MNDCVPGVGRGRRWQASHGSESKRPSGDRHAHLAAGRTGAAETTPGGLYGSISEESENVRIFH